MNRTNPYEPPSSSLGDGPSLWESVPLFLRRFIITFLWGLPLNFLWSIGLGADSFSHFFERAARYYDYVLWFSLFASVLSTFIPSKRKLVFIPVALLSSVALLFLALVIALSVGGLPAG